MSISNETNVTIQEMISNSYLTITHYLNTIVDSNHVLILNEGRVVELETLGNLVSMENGHKAMVKRSQAGQGNLGGYHN